MTPKELIEDTIEYYKTNPRGVNEYGHYAYLSEDGEKKCAVGRWIDHYKMDRAGISLKVLNGFGSIDNGYYEEIKSILKDEVKDISFELWEDLQNYHDRTLCSKSVQNSIKEEVEKSLLEKWSKN